MSIHKKELKVLLYGNIVGAYHRSQSLIKFLLDSDYTISLVSPNYYLKEGKKAPYVLRKLLKGIQTTELLAKAIFADAIYLLPLNTHLIEKAVWVSKLLNKKLIVEIYVSLYDTFIKDKKLFREGSKKAQKLMLNDKLALTLSDYIICTSNHESTYWAKSLEVDLAKDKVFVAPIFSDTTLVHKRKFMDDSVLRICWWGTFIPLHGLDKILLAMKLLKEREVRFTCNLFGVDNPFFSVYAEKIQSNNLDTHVYLRKDLKFFDNSLPQYLIEYCDLALGIFGDTDKAANAVPNKLVEALSLGIPTLTMRSPALEEFFSSEDLWTCEILPESIANRILEIAGGNVYPVDWLRTREKVLTQFSLVRYREVVNQVLNKIARDLPED